MSQDRIVVEHDLAAEHFRVELEGVVAVLQYRRGPGRISFLHTEVPPTLRGGGIASRLAQAGLEFARAEHLVVVPICPFVAGYVRRHPEYESLAEGQVDGRPRETSGAPRGDQEVRVSGYISNIERETRTNEDFRRVLFTGPHTQLVLMALLPGEEIGLETHEGHDQFIRVEVGTGAALLNGKRHALEDGSAIVIPAGVEHNVVNTSTEKPLKLYTLYSPPEHAEGTVHRTKHDATDEHQR